LELIEQIYSDPKFIKACRKITGGSELADDLLQHCAIKIYEKKIDSKSIKSPIQFFKSVAWREWYTPSSKFNQQYGHKDRVPLIGHTKAIPLKDESTFIDWLNDYLSEPKQSKVLKFQNEIFLLYLKLNSTQKVSEFLNIEINVIKKSVRNYTEIIENEYKNRNI
jgi:DNA-directed RNA polymerase specialized sigma24 family protein